MFEHATEWFAPEVLWGGGQEPELTTPAATAPNNTVQDGEPAISTSEDNAVEVPLLDGRQLVQGQMATLCYQHGLVEVAQHLVAPRTRAVQAALTEARTMI